MEIGSVRKEKQPVQYLRGVGEARARLFSRMDIDTVEDMLYHFPRQYDDRREVTRIADLRDGETCLIKGTVVSGVSETRPRRNLTVQKMRVRDESGHISIVWFNQRYLKRFFKTGQQYVFYGKTSKKYNRTEMQSPEYELLNKAKDSTALFGIIPIYPATSGLSQNVIRSTMKNALEYLDCGLDEILPFQIRDKYGLSEINYSMKNIHFPENEKAFENARYRLVFQELFILQLGLLSIKKKVVGERKGISFSPAPEIDDFLKGLPFELTGAQKKVLDEIICDMEKEKIMNRLLVGDVGSGKTIVALLAMLNAVYNGYQASLMVPTEILAEQHYSTIGRFLSGMGISIELLTGSTSKSDKKRISAAIEDGSLQIVIGTHALIQKGVSFGRLGLVITDEQHRFGVRQRAVLSSKGETPDVLVMSATPIPRTLALILYGDLDISVIDEMPPGRKPVKTYVVDESMRERINEFIRKKVRDGRQVYIVCPLVDESGSIDASSAVETAERIAENDFVDFRVRVVHGKMKPDEKEIVMKNFAQGEIDILVSTTVIEVGVDVPNAAVMVIENAERFGLAQLHQLRGRVGRGEHQSFCILYNCSDSKVTEERMKTMMSTSDGFAVAEKDLEIRGPGDFFGTRQHGLPELGIANLYRDMDILKKAQEAAEAVIREDGNFETVENRVLGRIINEKFHERLKELSLN